MIKIKVSEDGRVQHLVFDPGKTLSRNLFSHGFFTSTPLCSGLGLCGACRVRVLSSTPDACPRDQDVFSPGDLTQGWRLGCAHFPAQGMNLKLPLEKSTRRFAWASTSDPVALGVDIGTTTLKWGFAHPDHKTSLGMVLNPQMGAGSEIMSRLAYSAECRDNFKRLQSLLTREIQKITALCDQELPAVVAGNTAMIHFLMGLDISGLLGHPYHVAFAGGSDVRLPGSGREVFVPPLLSPFVGADISSGLSWLVQEKRASFPFLFCDLGTNGEMVLGLGPDRFFCTSVALGPALEGVGLRFGSPFGPGVAGRFEFTPRGIRPDNQEWNGLVSGSGYLSLLALLLKLDILDYSGRFIDPGSRLSGTVDLLHGRVHIQDKFYLSGRDVEEVLKVKAAFTLGVQYLLQKTSMTPERLARIYLGGALGEHAGLEDLDELGFLPKGAMHKCRVLGNSSLRGALVLAVDSASRKWVLNLPGMMQSLDLAGDREYVNANFHRHMHFEYPAST